MLAYNLFFRLSRHDGRTITPQSVERNILLQILFDLAALAMLLYFAGLPQNPFLSFFVFHMIIAGMYLRGNLPYLIAAAATFMVGAIMLLEYLEWIPRCDLQFPGGFRPAVFVDRVCRAGQHLVDRGLLHHGHPPLRGPGERNSARRRNCWASASWWPGSPTRLPIPWTACRTACSGSVRQSATIPA